MTKPDRIKVKKTEEMRTKDISKMIDEGGLGADKYYDIIKNRSSTNKAKDALTKENEEA